MFEKVLSIYTASTKGQTANHQAPIKNYNKIVSRYLQIDYDFFFLVIFYLFKWCYFSRIIPGIHITKNTPVVTKINFITDKHLFTVMIETVFISQWWDWSLMWKSHINKCNSPSPLLRKRNSNTAVPSLHQILHKMPGLPPRPPTLNSH